MKKLVIPLIILCFVLGFAAAPAFGHLCSDPFVTPLIAGGGNPKSAMEVGYVEVCNDGENLYVTYLTDEYTCLIETHLHVATDPSDIPQTKQGNPIPGHFAYSESHECVNEYTYTIPLAWETGDELYIAAHAVVETSSGTADACADLVADYDQGLRKDGTPVIPARSNPDQALGPSDSPSGVENFFSLGYGGSIILRFPTLVGGNLTVWEITWGTYPLEQADVYVSRDMAIWTLLGTANNTKNPGSEPHPSTFSLPECVGYVKIVDTTDSVPHNAQSDGFDVDAVCADYNCQEETAWGEGLRFNDKNWATYFMYTVQGEIPEIWPEDGTLSVAYEDLPIGGGNDWDYNDFVVDIDVLATFFGTSMDRDLVQIDFTVRPEAKIAGYTHVMHLDADTFACDGTYELYRDGVLVESGSYDDTTGIDVVLVPNTGSLPNEVLLTIAFTGDCQFSFPIWDPNLHHGENLFFDPYLHVNNTGQDIHTGDVRMLTVPVDWQWPTPDGNRICNVYPKVTNCTPGPPTFVPYWWTP